ncbi:MAG: bacterial transcriptional activator domain-containing protein [Zoogloea sp.]|nr:bacterial transcriptional activator domain-containing protein [Zoogloea sp.]
MAGIFISYRREDSKTWAIEVEPVAESFYRRLMSCYAQLGRRAEALAVYQRCRQSLLSRGWESVQPRKRRRSISNWPRVCKNVNEFCVAGSMQ